MSRWNNLNYILACGTVLAPALCFCAILFLPADTSGQTTSHREARIRVQTDLVTVPASVLDASGKPVADLPESAFKLYQDGVEQKIAKFETQTDRPLELALMVDSSLSTLKDTKFENEATARFIRLVVRPGDLLGVFEFSDYVYELSDFSANVNKLEAAAEKISPGSGTSLYDAIVLGSAQLETLPQDRRRVIVLVTDAGETTSRSSFEAARHAAIASEGLLYTILLRPVPNENGRNTGGEHAIETIIDSTGGAVYYPGALSQLDSMFEQISRELRTQYLLSYYPQPKEKPGTYCQIDLEIPGGHYTLHYRKGYFEAGAPEVDSSNPNANP
jgi:Ca-activated chloride channel homolog